MRVVESKATQGLPSVVASPNLRREGGYGTAAVRVWCLDPSKKCCDTGDGKKRTGSCAGIGVAPVQGRPRGSTGERKAADTVDGGREADGS